jgi:hypothetical protein
LFTFKTVGGWVKRRLSKSEREMFLTTKLASESASSLERAAIIDGMARSIGFLEQQRQDVAYDAFVTIASLLTTAGGSMTVAGATIAAVKASGIDVAYKLNPDGSVTASLVDAAAAQGQPAEPADPLADTAEYTCRGDCGCDASDYAGDDTK